MKMLNKWFKKTLMAAALFGLMLPSAYAQFNSGGEFAPQSPNVYRSTRALGMGNAYIALDGSTDSPFHNPAGLNDVEKWSLTLMSPSFEFSSSSLGLFADVADLVDDIDAAQSDSETIDALDQFVASRFGEFTHSRFGINLVSYVQKNFAAGVLLEERVTFAFRDQSLPKFDVQNITDLIFYVSGSYNWWEKLVQVGATVRPTIRTSIQERVTTATALNDELDDVFRTLLYPHLGFGIDLGFKSDLSIPQLMEYSFYKRWHEFLQPAYAMTIHNLGTTAYEIDLKSPSATEKGVEKINKFNNAVNDEPVDDEMTFNVGMKVSPKIAFLDTNFALDFRDLNRDGSVVRKLNFGAEVIFPVIVSVRTGLNHGYFAAGLGFDLKVVNIDFATYGEEVGVFERQQSDRRYAITLKFAI
jgi:hypothetical protein